jgi:HSP20 family protein
MDRHELIPSWFWRTPELDLASFFEDEEMLFPTRHISGLSVSEDDKNVYVEASVPGVDAKDVDVTYEKGVLNVRGEKKEEEKGKKYYRKATKSFSYRLTVPGNVDPNAEPKAAQQNGIVKLTFAKTKTAEPKKIPVKAG